LTKITLPTDIYGLLEEKSDVSSTDIEKYDENTSLMLPS